jgi:hypothetical protein
MHPSKHLRNDTGDIATTQHRTMHTEFEAHQKSTHCRIHNDENSCSVRAWLRTGVVAMAQ